ncbi:MAG: 4Fe-4S dicluster-binding protein [Candidatus Bathyarchaeia archaeon]|nr:4Fe-4S binding protein [Candidatus Bathyarchaeota archaeon]
MDKISVYRFLSAGCNACDVEVLECLAPRYGLASLGVEVVEEPEKANVLILTGAGTVKGREALLEVYEKINPPKIVIAVGNCSITKNIFDKGYPIIGPLNKLIPVNYYIPGCPPRPQAIIKAVADILGVKIEEREEWWQTPEGFRGRHEIDREKCIGCGACAQICTADAIEVIDGPEKRIIKVNYVHCTFCAFCQDECPTKALKLTGAYHLLTNDLQKARVENEVNLLTCAICGGTFFPEKQIDWALKRIVEEKAPIYRDFSSEILDAVKICTNCRRSVESIKKAKRLLTKLSEKARATVLRK